MSAAPSSRFRIKAILHDLGRFEIWLLALLALAALLPGVVRTPFHADESHWISTSRYFELLVRGQFDDPAWETQYWTLTQPPVTRYVIGVGRSLGGYGVTELNQPWQFHDTAAENTAAGAMPAPGLLHWSRLPMAVAGVIALVVLFWLLRRSAGRAPAYLFAFLFLLSPYLRQTLSRAMGEAPLLALTALAMLAGERVLYHGRRAMAGDSARRRRYLLWAAVLGICSGLAGATKLNGLGVTAAAVAITTCAAWPSAREGSAYQRWRLAVTGGGVVLALAAAAFIVVNPYLYSAPLHHTQLMFVQRSQEMATQMRSWPQSRLPDGLARLPATVARTLRLSSTYPTRRVWWMAGLLALAGGVAAGSILRQWRRGARDGGALLAMVLIAAFTVIPALFTPLDWQRYFLFPVVFSLVLVALGADYLWRWGCERRQKARRFV